MSGGASTHVRRDQGRSFTHDFPAATEDLAEALEIAERGGMRLHECDAHLEWARQLVNECGYGRLEREVRWLERALGLP